jgi:hypothetical protein
MQGSYNKDGLPRPYNMRPIKKKYSPYNKMPQQFFTTSRRKLVGYLVMLTIFGMMVFMVGQEMKVKPDPVYEVMKLEKERENMASNLAKAPGGKASLGLAEAPKGGIANEGVVVGSDEDGILGRNKKNPKKPMRGKIVEIDEEENQENVGTNSPAGAGAGAAAGAAAGAGAGAAPAGSVKDGSNKVKVYKESKNDEEAIAIIV